MRISPIELTNKSKFIVDYRKERGSSLKYFDYSPFNDDEKRLSYINERSYNRKAIVSMLTEMNTKWDASEDTFSQIKRLNDDKSVVIVGGQQAGLGTGPMYTVNKIISIIKLAREKEAQLKIPVIPLFWIAGEDHDYDEINHLFIDEDDKLKKLPTRQEVLIKKSVSHIELDQVKTEKWLRQLFLSLQETEETRDLYEQMKGILKKSKTFVDFFARTLFYLFQGEGLVLFDSADQGARELEREFFTEIIHKQEPFAKAVLGQLDSLQNEGHSVSIEADLTDTHLFYHDDRNERILLQREGENWVGKNDEISFTTDELILIAKERPEKLSNNVMSRPLMQEYLFPTLYFVAGDGEISYWAALKKAFQLFDFHMPAVIPRLSFTYVNKKVANILKERALNVEDAINHGVGAQKLNWLQAQQLPPISRLVTELKGEFAKLHEPLQKSAQSISEDVHQLAKRNLDLIFREVDYLQTKMETELRRQHDVELDKYDLLDKMIHPNGLLQERIWHPIPFINEYGTRFISKLIREQMSFTNEHYVIYL